MNFERHTDPFKTVGMGARTIAMHIDGLMVLKETPCIDLNGEPNTTKVAQKLSPSYIILALLGLEAKVFDPWDYIILVNTDIPLADIDRKYYFYHLEDEFFEYMDYIYYIPRK